MFLSPTRPTAQGARCFGPRAVSPLPGSTIGMKANWLGGALLLGLRPGTGTHVCAHVPSSMSRAPGTGTVLLPNGQWCASALKKGGDLQKTGGRGEEPGFPSGRQSLLQVEQVTGRGLKILS